MASYNYGCSKCSNEIETSHGMNETPDISCDECDTKMYKKIPKVLNFILKGDSWSGKNAKEKSYRMTKRKEMGKKMVNNHNIPQIQPNYKGELCGTWNEAKLLAKDDGVNVVKYEKQVENLECAQNKVSEKKKNLLKGEG